MTAPTPLQQIEAIVAPVNGECWVERLVIQGKPGGGVLGACSKMGWRVVGLPGFTEGGENGPWPLTAAADDPEFAAIIELINVQAIEQALRLEQELTAMTLQRDSLLLQVAQISGQPE